MHILHGRILIAGRFTGPLIHNTSAADLLCVIPILSLLESCFISPCLASDKPYTST